MSITLEGAFSEMRSTGYSVISDIILPIGFAPDAGTLRALSCGRTDFLFRRGPTLAPAAVRLLAEQLRVFLLSALRWNAGSIFPL